MRKPLPVTESLAWLTRTALVALLALAWSTAAWSDEDASGAPAYYRVIQAARSAMPVGLNDMLQSPGRAAVAPAPRAVAAGPVASERNPREICAALDAGALDSALALTQYWLKEARTDLTRAEAEYGGSPTLADLLGRHEQLVGMLLIARVEILAMKGAIPAASSALADADAFDREHPDAAMTWSVTGAPLYVARAFVLEKRGDLDGAALAYEAALDSISTRGWAGTGTPIRGRLAVVALQRGDDGAVERWSKDVLSFDPGANAAWGAVLQKRGDVRGARRCYAAALDLMNAAAGPRMSWSLPVWFAEWSRARNGAGK